MKMGRWNTGRIMLAVLFLSVPPIARGDLASYDSYPGAVGDNGGLDAVDGHRLILGPSQYVVVEFPTLLPSSIWPAPGIRVHMIGDPVGTDAWISVSDVSIPSWWGFTGGPNYDEASDADIFTTQGWGFYDTHVDFGLGGIPSTFSGIKHLKIHNFSASAMLAIDAVETGVFTPPVVNQSPAAVDNYASIEINSSATIDVLMNDSDPDGDILAIDSFTQGSNGSVTTAAVGVTYTSNENFVGTDSFTYTIIDGKGGVATATVFVTVNPGRLGIDIKPGSSPNSINLGSNGVVPVAILSTETFDATALNPETVFLEGTGVALRGKGNKYMSHSEDVNGDAIADLIVQIQTENLDPERFQDGTALITVESNGQILYQGEDEIAIVPLS